MKPSDFPTTTEVQNNEVSRLVKFWSNSLYENLKKFGIDPGETKTIHVGNIDTTSSTRVSAARSLVDNLRSEGWKSVTFDLNVYNEIQVEVKNTILQKLGLSKPSKETVNFGNPTWKKLKVTLKRPSLEENKSVE